LKISVSLLVVYAALATPALAQTLATSAVFGAVTDQSGAPLTGASVDIRGTTLIGGAHVALTSTDGSYRFGVLPSETYDVGARYPGLSSVTRGVAVPPGAAIRIDLELNLASIKQAMVVEGLGPSIDANRPRCQYELTEHSFPICLRGALWARS
jgi:hypothetical protein